MPAISRTLEYWWVPGGLLFQYIFLKISVRSDIVALLGSASESVIHQKLSSSLPFIGAKSELFRSPTEGQKYFEVFSNKRTHVFKHENSCSGISRKYKCLKFHRHHLLSLREKFVEFYEKSELFSILNDFFLYFTNFDNRTSQIVWPISNFQKIIFPTKGTTSGTVVSIEKKIENKDYSSKKLWSFKTFCGP